MKTIPPTCPVPDTGPKYWRSLDQLAETSAFRQWVEREFPSGASEMNDPVTRRSFVKLMSASFLLAGVGLTGCRRPVENIYPFSKMPEGYVHGLARFYATAMPTRRSAVPLVAKSDDGRPTKLEGNAQHPDSNGSADRYTQASILNLYDPDRATRFASKGGPATREGAMDALSQIAKAAQGTQGAGLAILMDQSSSPSRARLVKQISEKLPKAGFFEFEPVDFDVNRQAATLAFGQPVAPYFKLDEASVIVSLDSDFLGAEEDLCVNIRRFAKGRRTKHNIDSMSRLYAVEALMTVTGANADHRLPVPASAIPAVAARLALEILGKSGADAAALQALAGSATVNEKWVVECAKDLAANKGKCVVVAGSRQPLAVHVLANALNAALGNIGTTVILNPAPAPTTGSLEQLVALLGPKSKTKSPVDTLVILGGNPAYSAPVDLMWDAAVAKAGTVVRLGYYEDETFPKNGWSLPQAHFLESWSDARTADGTVVPVQPLIEPLFGGMTDLEVLARLGGLEKTSPYEIVRDTFLGISKAGEEEWKKFLHDGFLLGTAYQPVPAQLNAAAVTTALAGFKPLPKPDSKKLEVVFHRDYRMDDGRYNNNGWLQELPDPITKVTWENVFLMSVKTAKELGVYIENRENNDLLTPWVTVVVDGRSVQGPVWPQPGMADNVVGLSVGYGRSRTGRIGKNSGYNAYSVRPSTALHLAANVKLTPQADKKHKLSVTQDHGSMEGRPIIREATLEEYRKNGKFARNFDMEAPEESHPIYPNPFDKVKETALHQWGMSIDLSACVGCASCMVACQSENNIPIVGKEQVANNREMHWIRIDRYFSRSVENPQVVNQPMLCQHCEAAPCENVCPVNATAHDQEGLNVMVYNRCVGTRYCSNNCPYKVRRFNFFDYNRRPLEQLQSPYTTPLTHTTDGELDLVRWWKDPDRGNKPTDEWELLKLVKNPQVTVRMRGVMEKCSYCIQRIEGAKIAQKVKAGATAEVVVPEGVIKTACQQACPAEAIVFGNVADPKSAVSLLKKQDRNYSVLEFLATKPRTTYLARIRNPNPNMPDAYTTPDSSREYREMNHEPAEHEAPAKPAKSKRPAAKKGEA